MSMQKMSLNQLVDKWNRVKAEKNRLEKECERYRSALKRYMDKKEEDIVETDEYVVVRHSATRRTISKASVPKQIWDKYSSRITYSTYRIKKKS